MDAKLNMHRRSKVKKYEMVNEGDKVRVPVINKVKKGYKPQWSYQLETVDKKLENGLYEINGELYPRKELQLVKDVVQSKELSQKQIERKKKENAIGQAANNKLVKEIVDKPQKQQIKKDIESNTKNMRKRQAEKIDKDKYYIVDKILDTKTDKGKTYYLVKWKYYPVSQATWEPIENFKYPEKLGEKINLV
jgi:hypothetical protein